MTTRTNQHGQAHQLRIIGGKWKGRKLRFRGHTQLRPTAARTRETLFNWLRPELAGSACLDLFAGSGALGFEALSQGAAHTTMVESHRQTQGILAGIIQQLDIQQSCQLIRQPAQRYLARADRQWDIVFIDPPFDQPELMLNCMAQIVEQQLCTGPIYLEAPSIQQIEQLGERFGLDLNKQTRCGDAWGALLRR